MKTYFFIIILIFVFLAIVSLFLRSGRNAQKRKTAFSNLDRITDLNSNGSEKHSVSEHKDELSYDAVRRDFKHPALICPFYEQYIESHKQVLTFNNCYEPVLRLLICLDKHGDCSSVVHDGSESSYSRSENLYNLLGKISLLEHSLNVAGEIISIVNDGSGQDSDMRRGMLLIASLGHDLGKIPDLRKNTSYATGDHPIISQAELNRIMADSVPERQKILDAVRDHHLKTSQPLTLMLKKADHQARAKEIKMLSPTVSNKTKSQTQMNISTVNAPTKTDLSWMDINVLKGRIEEKINVLHNNKFNAFSMRNGLVYVMPELISSIVYDLAEAENRLDVINESKRNIEHTVRFLLKEYIPSDIGQSYNGRRYNLYNNGRVILKGFYMPIKVEAFTISIAELEKKKSGHLKKITRVEIASFPLKP